MSAKGNITGNDAADRILREEVPCSEKALRRVIRNERNRTLAELRGRLTQPQIAHAVWGVAVHTTGNVTEDRARRTAIRNVQHAIEGLRRRDIPVIDSPEGMRIARTSQEAHAEFLRLRSRIRSQSVTSWGLRRAARVLRAIEEGRVAEQEPVALTLGLDVAA